MILLLSSPSRLIKIHIISYYRKLLIFYFHFFYGVYLIFNLIVSSRELTHYNINISHLHVSSKIIKIFLFVRPFQAYL